MRRECDGRTEAAGPGSSGCCDDRAASARRERARHAAGRARLGRARGWASRCWASRCWASRGRASRGQDSRGRRRPSRSWTRAARAEPKLVSMTEMCLAGRRRRGHRRPKLRATYTRNHGGEKATGGARGDCDRNGTLESGTWRSRATRGHKARYARAGQRTGRTVGCQAIEK